MKSALLAIAVVACAAAPAYAAVIRVPRDHATIQAAVDAAAPGDKIVVKAGTYPENVVIDGKSNLLLRGSGTVTVDPAAGTAILVTNATGVRIKKVTAVSSGLAAGFWFQDAPNGLASKCTARGSIGFAAGNSNGTRFVACTADTTLAGITFGDAGTHTAERCTVTSTPAGRAIATAGDTAILIRCKVAYTGTPTMSPIRCDNEVLLRVERCRVQTAPTGPNIFALELAPPVIAARHELLRNRLEGCSVGIGSVRANNVTCVGNKLSGNTIGGIGIGGIDILIDRNKVVLGAGPTIGIGIGGTDGATITRNKVSRANGVTGAAIGVFILDGDGNTVARNTFKNLTLGVTLTGDANTIGPRNKYKNVGNPIDDNGTNTAILDPP